MIKVLKEKDFSKIIYFLQNNFSSPTHWPEWNVYVSKHYNTDFYYYAEYNGDELIGICPVHKRKNGILGNNYSGQFKFIPNGGWIFKHRYTLNLDNLPLRGINSYVAFSLPLLPEFNVNYKPNNTLKAVTLLVDLSKDIDDIWLKDIHSTKRNRIRKAEKNNITVEIDDKSNLMTFYNLYCEANKMYKLKSLKYGFFEDFFSNLSNIDIDILWAKKDNKILSGLVIVYDKNYSLYWLGMSNKEVENLGQGDLLHWTAIQRMKEKGCKYYDLCYIDKEKLPHLYQFKKGFSKTEIEIDILIKKTLLYRIFNKLGKFF
jgi:hypothetical protein